MRVDKRREKKEISLQLLNVHRNNEGEKIDSHLVVQQNRENGADRGEKGTKGGLLPQDLPRNQDTLEELWPAIKPRPEASRLRHTERNLLERQEPRQIVLTTQPRGQRRKKTQSRGKETIERDLENNWKEKDTMFAFTTGPEGWREKQLQAG